MGIESWHPNELRWYMERKVMKALQQLYLLQQDSLIRIVLPAKQDVKEIAIK